MINAYITGGEGIIKVSLMPSVPSLGAGSADEYALRNSFLDQQAYYAGKKTPGEVVGVINSTAAAATLFGGGAASIYFFKSEKRLTAKWTRV